MDIKDAIPVSMLNSYIKKIIDAEEILSNIKVYGEITDFSLSKNIAYFSLKDESALISCVCFSSANFALIKNGAQVVLTGSPNFWVKGGRLSFQVSKVEDFGKGRAYLEFLALKEKLEKQGLFAQERKKPVSKFTKKIGVVSSKTGAVIRDICNVATRRNPYVNIVLYPAQVQGEGASQTIIKGLKFLDSFGVDVIIIARGGGSNEDLSAFNDESLALEIANAKTPIVSAVGHETDFSICDFVADLRAPTPSAAAELTTIDVFAFFEYIKGSVKKIAANLNSKIDSRTLTLNLFKSKMSTSLSSSFERKNFALKSQIDFIKNFGESFYSKQKSSLDIISSKFEKLSPLEVLQRGFAKISKNNKSVSFSQIEVGDEVVVDVFEGSLNAKINSKKERK